MKKIEYGRIIHGAIFILALMMILFAFLTESREDTLIKLNRTLKPIPDLVFDGNQAGDKYKCPKADVGTIHHLEGFIPSDVTNLDCLTLKTMYCDVSVTIDGEERYVYPRMKHLGFTKMTGNVRLVIPLTEADAGKSLDIIFVRRFSQAIDLERPCYDSYEKISNYVIGKEHFKLIIMVILFTVFGLALIINTFAVGKGSGINKKLVYYYVGFVFTVAVWVFCSSELPQLLTDANSSVSVMSYLALSLMCPIFCGFCMEIFETNRKYLGFIQDVGWLVALMNILVSTLRISDFPDILICTHIVMVVTIISVFAISIKGSKHDAESRYLAFSICIMGISGVLGLYAYYKAPSSGLDGIVLGTGLVLLTLALFCLILYKQISFIEERKYLETYKVLAYTDMLTEVGNRKAFDEAKESILDKLIEYHKITLAIFDVNFLKEMNDMYGHRSGDELLVDTANCIKAVFEKAGTAYRLGGDEFAVILTDCDKDDSSIVNEFDSYMEDFNQKRDKKLSVAIGVQSVELNTGSLDWAKLFQTADDKMYANKKIKHEMNQ